MYIIIYLTKDYKTIFTLYNSIYCDKKIGSLNGYGWEIISIQYLIDKHFYTKATYEIIVRDKEREKEKFKFGKKQLDISLNNEITYKIKESEENGI